MHNFFAKEPCDSLSLLPKPFCQWMCQEFLFDIHFSLSFESPQVAL